MGRTVAWRLRYCYCRCWRYSSWVQVRHLVEAAGTCTEAIAPVSHLIVGISALLKYEEGHADTQLPEGGGTMQCSAIGVVGRVANRLFQVGLKGSASSPCIVTIVKCCSAGLTISRFESIIESRRPELLLQPPLKPDHQVQTPLSY